MRKITLCMYVGLSLWLFVQSASANDLLQVYQQALQSDPVYQGALAQEMVAAEAAPQARAALFPQISVGMKGKLNRSDIFSTTIMPPSSPTSPPTKSVSSYTSKQRAYGYTLNITQDIFNFSNWKLLSSANASVKAAVATYNYAKQDLIQRTVKSYFAVLCAEDLLRYVAAEKAAFYQEYLRAKQSFKVGMKTITDVYNAKAAYDSSIAQYVTANNALANAREDLLVIAGTEYKTLNALKKDIPLVVPVPQDINKWVHTSMQQNWLIKAANYAVIAAHEAVIAAQGGHLPTLSLDADYSKDYGHTIGVGPSSTKGPSIGLQIAMPLSTGGLINSKSREAIANQDLYRNKLEEIKRNVVNGTRKTYLGVVAGISNVKADRQAVISSRSALHGTREGYEVGVRTMLDVLNSQKIVYQMQQQYAKDRYSYIMSTIALKQAAGTLNFNDLQMINHWLVPSTIDSLLVKKSAKNILKSGVSSIAKNKGYHVQLAAYKQRSSALNAVKKVSSATKIVGHINPIKLNGGLLYRVQIGPLSNLQINKVMKKLKVIGFSNPIVMSKKSDG